MGQPVFGLILQHVYQGLFWQGKKQIAFWHDTSLAAIF
jgi:hypothetical protein